MRPIDADELIVHLEQCKGYAKDIGMPNATYSAFDAVIMDIKEMPTAEKTGKWIRKIGMVTCDQCLRAIRRIDCDGLLNFCPNCGARMDV